MTPDALQKTLETVTTLRRFLGKYAAMDGGRMEYERTHQVPPLPKDGEVVDADHVPSPLTGLPKGKRPPVGVQGDTSGTSLPFTQLTVDAVGAPAN